MCVHVLLLCLSVCSCVRVLLFTPALIITSHLSHWKFVPCRIVFLFWQVSFFFFLSFSIRECCVCSKTTGSHLKTDSREAKRSWPNSNIAAHINKVFLKKTQLTGYLHPISHALCNSKLHLIVSFKQMFPSLSVTDKCEESCWKIRPN